LQVELDRNQWPTYRFKPGVAETSLAHRTAARLGVTREELLALVERSRRAQASAAGERPKVVLATTKGDVAAAK
jgi:DNA mismatch repair protein MutS2